MESFSDKDELFSVAETRRSGQWCFTIIVSPPDTAEDALMEEVMDGPDDRLPVYELQLAHLQAMAALKDDDPVPRVVLG